MHYIGVNSSFHCKIIEIAAENIEGFAIGDTIVYRDNEKKDEIGVISYILEKTKNADQLMKDYSIVRKVTPHDLQKIETNKEISQEAFVACSEKIREHKLEMHLMQSIFSFDRSKINFIFTADDRVDFRELVKDLAKHFQKQIHLQQIGPRDKARFISGFGKCGQRICCNRFLHKLSSISMDMVRMQNMTNKGSEKLSGCCGKLMCCLAFEVEEYKLLRQEFPPIRSIVKTKEFSGEIVGIDVFNNKLKILINQGEHKEMKIIPLNEIEKIISKPKAIKEEERFEEDAMFNKTAN